MKITALVGNPAPGGRTTALAAAVAQELSALVKGDEVDVEELAPHAAHLFSRGNADLESLLARVADSDFVVIASPTYKASYTGLLKSFLDHYGTGGLKGVVAVPVFTGGSPAHSLAPDATLRPLLAELGASVPSASLYVVTAQMETMPETVAQFIQANRYQLLGAAHGRALLRAEAGVAS